jgi:dTDP-4-amino-4,6-dideoxygalactose transaminase
MEKPVARVNVTKTFLPPIEEYQSYLARIWESGQLTNQGPLVQEFERQAEQYLGVSNFHFVSNGTMALQLALNALGITEGEVITTPFTYVATTSAILWERCQPVFVDIDPATLTIDPAKIEAAITPSTKAILSVHVFGIPCDVHAIAEIAKKHNLKVIYDAAHAFSVEYEGQSLLAYGDISICSFHATKLFHTIEGGCVVTSTKELSEKVELTKRFGHTGDEHFQLGINAKASEFQAAMGLCSFKYIDGIIRERQELSRLYDTYLGGSFVRPTVPKGTKYNYAYYPILFDSEAELLAAMHNLELIDVHPRRYFYPSLNTLPYLQKTASCPISEDISRRVLCLPLYFGLQHEIIKKISEVLS